MRISSAREDSEKLFMSIVYKIGVDGKLRASSVTTKQQPAKNNKKIPRKNPLQVVGISCTMSSHSNLKNQLSALTAKERQELMDEIVADEENENLRIVLANHPTLLRRLSVRQPSQTANISLRGGAGESSCAGIEKQFFYRVSFPDQRVPKELSIRVRKWNLSHSQIAGAFVSTVQVLLVYGDSGENKKDTREAVNARLVGARLLICALGDIYLDHCGVKTILKDILDDLEYSNALTEIQLLNLLVDKECRSILDEYLEPVDEEDINHAEEYRIYTTREIIEREIVATSY
jgi:hypothetical protein